MSRRLLIALVTSAAACVDPPVASVTIAATDGGTGPIDLAPQADLASQNSQNPGQEAPDLAKALPPPLVTPADLAVAAADLAGNPPPDLGAAPESDLAVAFVDMATALPDLSTSLPDLATSRDAYVPPGGTDTPLAHAPPSPMSGATTLLGGQDTLDVSTDQGGGVWVVTASRVYYFAPGGATYSYDQSSGLARGWATWTDTWFSPGTHPVTFASVAGGASGEAVIGNIGAIADRIQVNPSTGAVVRIDNMSVHVDPADPESEEQSRRVVAAWRTIADLNGTFSGTAYLGGFHGYYAFHGLVGDCQCQVFQQHQHAFADWAPGGIGGGDVRALALDPDGDVWQGDRDLLALWPQRSLGTRADFFQSPTAVIDVFPAVKDEIWGVGVDGANGVYVASYGQGLAYVAPATHALSYWTRATTLPQNRLTDVTVDRAGEVWVATLEGGVARFNPAANGWSYYTSASGLASNHVRRLYSDKYGAARRLYFATSNGVTVFAP